MELLEVIKTYDDLSDGELKYLAKIAVRKNNASEIVEELKTIEDNVFQNCYSLEMVTIGKSVKSIGKYMVGHCNSLTSIKVLEDNPNFDSRGGCNAIIETATNTLVAGCSATVIPQDVQHIGGYAFCYIESLTSIDIPDSVESIGDEAFYGCESLPIIDIPNSVETIGDYAFYGCVKLEEVTLGNSLKTIGEYAFYECEKLEKVTLGNSLKTIGISAFCICIIYSRFYIAKFIDSVT